MGILPVTLYGDKILRKKAKKIEKIDNPVIKLIGDMFETMRNADGMGLAANQVGSDSSLFIIDLSLVKGYEKLKPMVFINPKIIGQSEEESLVEEGCLSIPDIRAKIKRPEAIKIVYNDPELKEHTLEADKLLARVIQHEYDHLQGIFFTDRLDDETLKRYKKSLLKIKNRKIEIDYPVTPKNVY
ncbi:MAG: peptide deformylase [Ignavibacteria bacterium]|jgi:peptide deformylase|nr:peptide deformylase [Ignavibacteria bacterium]